MCWSGSCRLFMRPKWMSPTNIFSNLFCPPAELFEMGVWTSFATSLIFHPKHLTSVFSSLSFETRESESESPPKRLNWGPRRRLTTSNGSEAQLVFVVTVFLSSLIFSLYEIIHRSELFFSRKRFRNLAPFPFLLVLLSPKITNALRVLLFVFPFRCISLPILRTHEHVDNEPWCTFADKKHNDVKKII